MDDVYYCTPPEIRDVANSTKDNLLPDKSKDR